MRLRFFPAGMRGKIWRAILLPMTGLIVAACIIPAFFYHDAAQTDLENRVDRLAAINAVPMQTHLWQYDLGTVQEMIDSYVELGVISAAQVTDGQEINLTAGPFGQSGAAYSLEVPLFGQGQSGARQIGTMRLEASKSEIWQTILFRLSATVLIALGFVFLTALVILRLLNRSLLRPILQISDTLKDLPKDWQNLNLDLTDRHQVRQPDELTVLVDAIHAMRDQVLAAQMAGETSEKRLARAAKLTRLGYASFDVAQDRFLECDEFFAESCNMTIEQVLAMDVRRDFVGNILRDEDPEKLHHHEQMFRNGRTVETVVKYSLGNNEVRFVRQILHPTPNPATDQPVVEIVSLDVTDQHIAEEQLLQAQKLDAIGKLTGGVAHDFNNLLAVISGNIELTLLTLESPSERSYLEVALSAVTSGANLTHQLLSFARKQPLSPESFDAAMVIKQSSALLRTSVGDAIDLEIVAGGGLWKAFADPEKLKTTLLNLVVNGRDAMPDGGALSIEVSNTRLDRDYANHNAEVKEGQYVCITVTDSGQGMGDETIQRALEPFFTTKGVGKGTGLGLPMAFGFAKQSGGHLKIYSEIGKGTSVKLYLPRSKTQDEDKRPDRPTPLRAKFEGMTVLIVEDNTDLRKTYGAMLDRMGCRVHSAANGPSAVEMAQTLPHVDLILSDVVLPGGMDGNQVARRLAEFYPKAAVIFMSGFTENSIIHNGRLDEGVTLLQKPFTANDLAAAILAVEG